MSRRRLLVPEARAALEKMKLSTLQELSRPSSDNEAEAAGSRSRDGGSLTTKEAGEMGGPVGGKMVRRLVDLAREELARRSVRP